MPAADLSRTCSPYVCPYRSVDGKSSSLAARGRLERSSVVVVAGLIDAGAGTAAGGRRAAGSE
jgi:hypothetical protein